jgi:hypothetical protein
MLRYIKENFKRKVFGLLSGNSVVNNCENERNGTTKCGGGHLGYTPQKEI